MLCLYQLKRPEPAPREAHVPQVRPQLKVGPLWKLMHVVEPRPMPTHAFTLRDEKDELLVIDGPFVETKA